MISSFIVNFKTFMIKVNRVFLVSFVAGTFCLHISSCISQTYSNTETPTYKVKKKNLEILISDTAEIGSEVENDVTAPFSSKVENILDEGTVVKKSAVIGSLATVKETEEKEKSETGLKETEYELKLSIVENDKEFYRLGQELINAQLELKKSELILKRLSEGRDGVGIVTSEESLKTIDKELVIYELDLPERTKLVKSGYMSEDELNQAKTKYKELKKIKQQTLSKLKVLYDGPTTEEIEKEKVNVDIATEKLRKAKQELESFKIKARLNIKENEIHINKNKESYAYYSSLVSQGDLLAPSDGMVVYGKMFVGREEVKIKSGDSVREGVTIAKVIDVNKPILRLFGNEVDVGKLKQGQIAKFYLDAYPEKQYKGLVLKIAPIANKKFEQDENDVRVFETQLRIVDKDQHLQPGMTANVEIVTEKFNNVIVVPSQAILKDKDEDYCYIKSDKGFIKQSVVKGSSNELETIIKDGLKDGDLVSLKPSEVEIK